MTALLLLGGSAIIAGVLLPWMTFYAGLQRMNGLQGRHGLWLLGAGIAVIVCGILQWRAPRRWTAWTLSALGVFAAVGCGVLLQRVLEMRAMPGMTMLVPQTGPGLYVALLGATRALLGGMRAVRRV